MKRYYSFVLVFALALAGCGNSGPRMAPVSGTLKFKGRPVAGASVSFMPRDPAGRAATGITDSQGDFTLGTFAASDGAILGSYQIGVIARGAPRQPKPGESGSGMPGEMMPGDPIIPAKYFAPDTSGLSHEVTRGKNTVPLELAD